MKRKENKLKLKLGINLGFASNRFPLPEQWAEVVGKKLGLSYVQFVADLLNPFFPERIIDKQIRQIQEAVKEYKIHIETTFTGAFTRAHHILHPDPDIRKAWIEWFKKWFEISVRLGARGSGSHFGILSVPDHEDIERRERLTKDGIINWQFLTRLAKDIGLEFLMFEPMSVGREFGDTIEQAQELHALVNENSSVPFLFCLDVDHGNAYSGSPQDGNPYIWLEKFGHLSPSIHIKQSLNDKSRHCPFSRKYNEKGIITPEKVIEALEKSGAEEVTLLLEISHRERYPEEPAVTDDLKESVEYWRRFIDL